jgi:hypothetical protein
MSTSFIPISGIGTSSSHTPTDGSFFINAFIVIYP